MTEQEIIVQKWELANYRLGGMYKEKLYRLPAQDLNSKLKALAENWAVTIVGGSE